MKSCFVRSVLVLCLFVLPYRANAETARLSGHEIKETLSEASLKLDTPFGITIPIYFGNDGIISGKASGLASYLGSSEDRGRWWISNDKLCFKWFRWLHSETQCLALQLKERRIFWSLEDGLEGTATLEDKPAPKLFVLKAPPQRVLRQAQVSSSLLQAKDDTTHKSGLFSLGFHLSQAMNADKKYITTHEIATSSLPQQTPEPSRKDQDQIQTLPIDASTQTRVMRRDEERPTTLPKILKETVSSKKENLAETYVNVAGLEAGDSLNIRSGPSPDQTIIGAIPQNNTPVKFLGPCQNLWCRVQFQNVNGWVSKYYLAEGTLKEQVYN